MNRRRDLGGVRRIVVKIGSALLVRPGMFDALAAAVVAETAEVVVVSSGAIALGLAPMGLAVRPRDIGSLQAAAAAGQCRLMTKWASAFEAHRRDVAQVLLTHADVEDRRRYLNARNALRALLAARVIPIVNENDTVAVEEIRFGDNDTLAADVAGLVSADLLVLLTSVDGLYSADPRQDPAAQRIAEVERIEDVRGFAGAAALHGTGGMVTKLVAAERAARHGVATVICDGTRPDALAAVIAGEDVGTLFRSAEPRGRARKAWMATALRPAGVVRVDVGAERAVRGGASLLPAGIVAVEGSFDVGDPVDVGVSGSPFARGLCGIASDDLRRICGLRTAEAREVLGVPVPDEVVHRDDLVLL